MFRVADMVDVYMYAWKHGSFVTTPMEPLEILQHNTNRFRVDAKLLSLVLPQS